MNQYEQLYNLNNVQAVQVIRVDCLASDVYHDSCCTRSHSVSGTFEEVALHYSVYYQYPYPVIENYF
jgi:hypothetical protein